MKIFSRALIQLLFGLLALFVQSTVLRGLAPEMLVPNLMLLSVIYLAFKEINAWGCFICFLLGLEADLYIGTVLGPSSGAFVVFFILLAIVSQHLLIENFKTLVTVGFLGSLLVSLLYLAVAFDASLLNFRLVAQIFWEAVINALVVGILGRLLFDYFIRLERYLLRFFT